MKTKFIPVFLVLFPLLQASNLYGGEDTVKYYPLKQGMTWTYSALSEKSETKTIIVTNLPPREINGLTLTPRKWDTGGGIKYYLVGTDEYGTYRYGEQNSEQGEPIIAKPKVYYIKNPISNGTSWDIKTKLGEDELTVNLTIESLDDEVKVPAGTFKNCIKIKHVGGNQKNDTSVSVEAFEWYAPDVGLVKSIVAIKKLEKKQPTYSEHLTYQLESFKP